jgi:hypothetical protein
MVCNQRRRLFSIYQAAVSDWAAKAASLNKLASQVDPKSFGDARENVTAARREAEDAKRTFLEHLAEHGCKSEATETFTQWPDELLGMDRHIGR